MTKKTCASTSGFGGSRVTAPGAEQARESQGLSRRSFLGVGAAAVGAAAFGLAGCAPQATTNAGQADTAPATTASAAEDPWAGFRGEEYAGKADETVDVDICVIGSGASGMVAAVEAAQNNKKVLVLESQDNPGGNGMFTDCCFSYGSPQMKEGCAKYGLTVTPSEIIRSEIELYDYMVNPLLWADTIAHSADNTAWMVDNGVRFAPTTDYYAGTLGKTPTALMWEDSFFSGGECMMKPLFASAEKLGVETRTGTRAKALKTADDGSVTGVFAETKKGVVEINAKAVILAGGGWAANTDMLAQYGGYDMAVTKTSCAPGSVGDTLKMAAAIGARQEAGGRGYMFGNLIEGLTTYSLPQYYTAIWVNEDGDRFANENCGEVCHDYTGTAVRAQKSVYIILNDAMIDEAEAAGSTDLRKEIETALSGSSTAVFKGADAADLAKKTNWTGDFAQTLATYEDYVAKKNDDEFGKDPKYLVSFGSGPLYALLVHQEIALSLGGIITNRHWQVVDEGKQPIDNLYAIGADGQMVYLGLYNLNTSGGHMATNVESGRYAVKHAVEHCF